MVDMNLIDGEWENPQISSNNNGQNQFLWACKTEHQQQTVQQTIVLTKTAGQQPGSGHLLRWRNENVQTCFAPLPAWFQLTSGWIPGHFKQFWVARTTNIASISWGCGSDTTCRLIATKPPYWKTWMTWERALVSKVETGRLTQWYSHFDWLFITKMKGLSPLTLNVQLPPTVLIILLYLWCSPFQGSETETT